MLTTPQAAEVKRGIDFEAERFLLLLLLFPFSVGFWLLGVLSPAIPACSSVAQTFWARPRCFIKPRSRSEHPQEIVVFRRFGTS